MKRLGIILAGLWAHAAVAQDVALPSGQTVSLIEEIAEDQVLRLRYLAPWVAQGVSDEDLLHLCQTRALERLAGQPEVIISLSEAQIRFGDTDPSVFQVFAPFTIDAGQCIGEAY